MKIQGEHYTTIWLKEDEDRVVRVIDQRHLPHDLVFFDMRHSEDAITAIRDMIIRGAPLIGITAAYGMWLACFEAEENQLDQYLNTVARKMLQTRPTAVNLAWAIDHVMAGISNADSYSDKQRVALQLANKIKAEDIEICRNIGLHGMSLIEEIHEKKQGKTVNILTHCNAGWLATSDWGTATSPIYQAFDKGIDLHVWVDETRPRNQGAKLTAFELGEHGVPHTLIADNTGGHLMQHGMVDLVITGTDRTTRHGDVANKIGTYLKALAAKDNSIPFYVALPSTTIDWSIGDGVREIPIEQRSEKEVKHMDGKTGQGIVEVLIAPENTPAANFGFDVTPARLVTGLITERGICDASEEGIRKLFPEFE